MFTFDILVAVNAAVAWTFTGFFSVKLEGVVTENWEYQKAAALESVLTETQNWTVAALSFTVDSLVDFLFLHAPSVVERIFAPFFWGIWSHVVSSLAAAPHCWNILRDCPFVSMHITLLSAALFPGCSFCGASWTCLWLCNSVLFTIFFKKKKRKKITGLNITKRLVLTVALRWIEM